MSETAPSGTPGTGQPDEDFIAFTHQEFRTGLPAGRFRVVVNPQKARRYLKHRLLLTFILLPLIGIGAALAITGSTWLGLAMVALGVVGHRLISRQAGKILLHLALSDPKVYRDAIDYEIMEVRLAR